MRRQLKAWLVGAVLLLAGCVMSGAGYSVLSGALTLATPAGYCLEPGSRREQADTAILIGGRCQGQAELAPAVLTATVGVAGSGTGVDIAEGGAELTAFFRSGAGRRALSRRGRERDVEVLEAIGTPQAFLVRLVDRAPQAGASVQAESWRAVFPVNRRLVSLSVSGTAAAPLSREAGRALIEAFVAAVRAANQK